MKITKSRLQEIIREELAAMSKADKMYGQGSEMELNERKFTDEQREEYNKLRNQGYSRSEAAAIASGTEEQRKRYYELKRGPGGHEAAYRSVYGGSNYSAFGQP